MVLTSSWSSYSVALVAIILALLYVYAKRSLNYWKRRGVKTPPTDLVFGNFKNAALFRAPPGWYLGDIHRSAELDDPYIGFFVFHKPCLMLRDPHLIKQVLIKDFDVFPDRRFGGNAQVDSLGLKNLLGLNSPNWKYVRSKLSPAMTGGKLKKTLPLMLEAAKPILDFVASYPTTADGLTIIDVKDISSRYSTDVISSVAFGITTNSFDEADTLFWKKGRQIFGGFERNLVFMILFFIPEVIPIFTSRLEKAAKFFRDIFWDSMESRERSGTKRGDLIDSLLQLKNEEQNPDFKFEGDNLLAQAAAFYVAGFEASSTTMAFTLLELARNTECQERARRDIEEAIELHGLSYKAFNEMKYLDQAISETLRLHPPLPMVDRIATQDYKIPGHDLVIEKGTPVYISLNAIQEDPRFFPDPEVYDPERFRDNNSEDVSGTYLPFGLGPRSCIGLRIGLLLTKVGIATILRSYEIVHKKQDKSVLDARSTFTAAANGVNLQFEKLVR